MSPARPGGRFERHPRLTGAALVVVALLAAELGLRLAPPVPLRFAHEMRRVHRYSRVSRVDLRPSQSAWLRIDRADGRPLFDFQLLTGPLAYRIEETALMPPSPRARIVHAVGDSYTMGWGVDAASSYPARLARLVAPDLHVLNLGVDGFGAIGAAHKSRELSERFPPEQAVYLFCPNDLDDDERAAALAGRGALGHAAHETLDALRRASYLASVPFAVRYRMQFREGVAGTAAGSGPETAGIDPTTLRLPEPAALPAPPAHHPTFTALLAYRDFLAARGARLSVLALSNAPESLMVYRFCRERGIDVVLFDVPPAGRIPGEGHFNAAGNEAVAALVAGLLADAGAAGEGG